MLQTVIEDVDLSETGGAPSFGLNYGGARIVVPAENGVARYLLNRKRLREKGSIHPAATLSLPHFQGLRPLFLEAASTTLPFAKVWTPRVRQGAGRFEEFELSALKRSVFRWVFRHPDGVEEKLVVLR